jgi:hypothetical protein
MARQALWPTPKASPSGPDYAREGRPRSGGDDLATAVARLVPTPTAGDAKSSGSRNLKGSKAHKGVSLTDYVTSGDSTTPRVPTPTVSDSKGPSPGLKREGSDNLAEFVMFLTPTASNRDSAGGTNSRRKQERDGTYISGQLNPTWVEWLMGFPLGWTDLEASATRSSRRSPSGSDSRS